MGSMDEENRSEQIERLQQQVESIGIELETTNLELQAQGERWRLLVENAPLGILSMDLTGQIIDLNPALLKILGSPSAEATRAINMLTFPPLIASGASANIRRCIEEGQTITCEHPYQTKWGKSTLVRYYLTPILNAAGEVIGAQALVEDRAEAIRAEAAEALARRMETVGTMAAGVAHDTNVLFGAILGHATAAKERLDPLDPNHMDLKGILDACRQGRGLALKLASLARRPSPELVEVDLAPLIEALVEEFRSTAPRGVEVSFEVRGPLPRVEADAAQLGRAILEVCRNALVAAEGEGRIGVVLEAVRSGQEPQKVQIRISDDGPGMPPEILEHAFEPFFTTHPQGSVAGGLGLAIVYGCLRTHGGDVCIESTPGQGTTLTLELPAKA